MNEKPGDLFAWISMTGRVYFMALCNNANCHYVRTLF